MKEFHWCKINLYHNLTHIKYQIIRLNILPEFLRKSLNLKISWNLSITCGLIGGNLRCERVRGKYHWDFYKLGPVIIVWSLSQWCSLLFKNQDWVLVTIEKISMVFSYLRNHFLGLEVRYESDLYMWTFSLTSFNWLGGCEINKPGFSSNPYKLFLKFPILTIWLDKIWVDWFEENLSWDSLWKLAMELVIS